MKLIYTAAALMALIPGSSAEPSPTCLNCKLKDGKSSFMYSFSYCKDTDACLADEWNYINAWCKSIWVPGW
jgi:hypothetical protein